MHTGRENRIAFRRTRTSARHRNQWTGVPCYSTLMTRLVLLLVCAWVAGPGILAGEEPYDSPPVFLCRPGVGGSAAITHVGVTGLQVQFGPQVVVRVAKTEPDTPAHGKFTEGDILLAVGGQKFRGRNPMVVLGNAITAAEATDGKMVFAVKVDENATKEVMLQIPVLGAYSPTWPLNCEKSKKIIEAHSRYVIESKILAGNGIGPSISDPWGVGSPLVRSTTPACRPSSCNLQIVPPAPSSASSGCGATTSTSSAGISTMVLIPANLQSLTLYSHASRPAVPKPACCLYIHFNKPRWMKRHALFCRYFQAGL